MLTRVRAAAAGWVALTAHGRDGASAVLTLPLLPLRRDCTGDTRPADQVQHASAAPAGEGSADDAAAA